MNQHNRTPTNPTTESDRLRQQADALMAESSAISERFAGGQPIILGHHSERGARRDRAQSEAKMRRAGDLYDRAKELDEQAAIAERGAAHQAIRDAAPTITRADVEPGDVVWTLAGTWRIPHRVVRVNAKSVSVETGFSWTDLIRYGEVIAVTKGGQP